MDHNLRLGGKKTQQSVTNCKQPPVSETSAYEATATLFNVIWSTIPSRTEPGEIVMKKAIVIALSSLFILPAALATESTITTYTFTQSEHRTISEIRLTARHVGQEIQHGATVDALYNAHNALASVLTDPAMQIARAEEKNEDERELAMK